MIGPGLHNEKSYFINDSRKWKIFLTESSEIMNEISKWNFEVWSREIWGQHEDQQMVAKTALAETKWPIR